MNRFESVLEKLCALKGAVDDLVTKGGGNRRCAEITERQRHQAFQEFRSVDHMDKWPNLKDIALIEAKRKSPVITRELARHLGYELVKVPEASRPADWSRAVGSLSKETGEALNVVLQAFATGSKIDADEIKRWHIDGELDEAIIALLRVKVMVEREVDEAQNGD
nr:hypothetical protein [uncultured Cohaesibacter sp.]